VPFSFAGHDAQLGGLGGYDFHQWKQWILHRTQNLQYCYV
jgi:hypothetical protein